MAGVLAWVVAVGCHRAVGGRASPLDFKAPVTRRALEWAEWLAGQPGTRLLLNASAPAGSAEAARVQALQPRLLNAADAHAAGSAALHGALAEIRRQPAADLLLLVWIGHGVMNNRQRYLVHADAEDAANLHSWEVDSLLQHLRSDKAPALQLGFIDTCAQVLSERPGHEQLGGAGRALRRQHVYFAATAAVAASVNPFEPTLASLGLQAVQALPWPPQPETLDPLLRPRLASLPSRPFRLEWTDGSGDQWSSGTAGGAPGAPTEHEVSQQARRSEQPEESFRHLWRELARTGVTPGRLAQALRRGRLPALARELARDQPDAPTADLLLDAWARVQRVEPWLAPLATLGLSLPQWNELARQVANQDLREVPAVGELRALLLWALDMPGDRQRAHAALLRLMWSATLEAPRAGACSEASAQAVRAQLQADAELAPLLPAVQAAAAGPPRPVVLCIELDLPPAPRPPGIVQHWLLRDGEIEPGAPLELLGELGEQLNALINAVQSGEPRAVRVELLAPFYMLCGQPEWLRYRLDAAQLFGGDAGLPLVSVELDTRWPISWRWKDRLKGRAELQPARWQQRAAEVHQRAAAAGALKCRFDDEPPAAAAAEPVRGLVYLPPSPQQQKRNLQRFLQALLDGDPYMLWPGEEPADGQAFKAAVRAWLPGQQLDSLPENLRRAREAGQLPALVLFIDEPDANPYRHTQVLQPLQPVPPP